MATKLDARTVAKLKPSAKARYINDALVTGLAVRVAPSGVKTWSVRYRIGRRLRRLTLSKVESLADARAAAKTALKLVSKGVDPAEVKQEKRDADTVADFAHTYIEKHAKAKKKSWRGDQRMLKCQVLQSWKHRPMKDITRRDVRVLLDGIVARGAPIVANRTHSLLSKFFAFALEKDVIETNPVRDLPKPSVEHIRKRVLTDDEIRAFWKTCETLDPPLAALWKIRLLTAKRPGEPANMRWQDIDLKAGWWVSPGEHEKNGVTHRVALSAPVVKLLRELHEDQIEGYVFAGVRGKKQHAVTFPLPDFQPKDLRKTTATYLSGLGIADATIDAVLNHKKVGIIKVYNLNQYDSEKRIALDLWSRTVTRILKQTSADVLSFAVGS